MMLPDYWLTRPGVDVDERTLIAFDDLLNKTLGTGGCPTIDFTLPWPKWQFLCHLADHHDIALHGSGDPKCLHIDGRLRRQLPEVTIDRCREFIQDVAPPKFFVAHQPAARLSLLVHPPENLELD